MVAAVFNKKSVPAPRVPSISQRIKKPSPLKVPSIGWRNPTVRDTLIINEIVKFPKLTAREYGDRLGVTATAVNEAIYFTRQGRTLAEQGQIAIPSRGKGPAWARLLSFVPERRSRVDQFRSVRLPAKVTGENRSSIRSIAALIAQLSLHSSPILIRQIRDEINAELVSTGRARAADQERIAAVEAVMAA